MFRDTGDKLERHEYRERQLGDQLKKALVGLDKRHRTADHNLNMIVQVVNRMDERLISMEKTLAQRDERERIHLQRTTDALDKIQGSLKSWTADMQDMVHSSGGKNEEHGTNSGINARIDHLANSVERLEAYIRKVSEDPTEGGQSIVLQEASKKLESTAADTERVLSRYETRLVELQDHGSQGLLQSSEDWHAIFLTALEAHQRILHDLKKMAEQANNHLNTLPSHKQIAHLSNSTHEMLQEIRYEIAAGTDKGITKLDAKLTATQDKLVHGQEEILKTITDTGVIAEGVYGDITRSYEELLKEVRRSGEVESVLIQTADNVMDTKRRIEYGVHQILLEVGDLVKVHAKELNATVNRRFDNLSSTIVDNQSGALSNLTSKIETEISQVWRQIGIMYQQLTASAGALDRLQQQTESYVNGSLSTMGSMGGKVSQITGLMAEMDNNLNYLLGRLSLVTQEFNSIKSDLGSALDNIRHAFISVQKKVKEFGKNGIIPIPDSQEDHSTSNQPEEDEGNQVSPLNVRAQ
ncbi:hypothetical protein C0J52_26192 [Blattella germanica]|nr:hypothetical protein C0J52_26192 [Blattella germanica]